MQIQPRKAANFNDHMASRGGININKWIGRDLKGSDLGVIYLLFWCVAVGTEKHHEWSLSITSLRRQI